MIRGAAPDVVIGQSTAARAGARPYRAGEVARVRLFLCVHTNDSTLIGNKGRA